MIWYDMMRRQNFTSVQTLHTVGTHTHPAFGRVVSWHMRWKWRWKGEWRWDGSENEMKDYLSGTRGGERKRRGKEQTPTPTHLARSGQTLKGQGKRKAEADGHGKRPAEGGRTEVPEPTYHSETYAYLGTHRTQPTWGGKNAWNRGPNGGLVQRLKGTQFRPKESCVTPNRDWSSQATWA